MPITYEIDKARGVIRTRCVGHVVFAEVAEHFRTLFLDPACPERLDVLLDLSEMTSVPGVEQLKAVPGEIGRIRDRVRFEACAIVATSDLLFGLTRMFEVFAEEQFRTTCVFRDASEAEAWLIAQQMPAG